MTGNRGARSGKGSLGILIPGLGAVGTTVIAGVMAIRRGLGLPIGSVTQLGRFRQDPNDEQSERIVKDALNLVPLDRLHFAGWDIFEGSCYESAVESRVLEKELLQTLHGELSAIRPMPAVFSRDHVKRLDGPNLKRGRSWFDLAEQVKSDIQQIRKEQALDRLVMVWCGSTETFITPNQQHESLAAFERAMSANDPGISPSMVYAYAALSSGVPFANGAPNLTVDIPAMVELANEYQVPVCGKDFKTGQTLMKTIIAPGLKARMIGLSGWFSTNILGNRDGAVLADPGSFKTKEISKLSVLDSILDPKRYPELYGDITHTVRINYYPPRGDNKEGWDNIDINGWLGYPMQIKVDFLCRDSILAAPLVLDLALLLDLAQRKGLRGPQDWLSFYFKSPMTAALGQPEHDLFRQQQLLHDQFRRFAS